jgi:hypothetical protein
MTQTANPGFTHHLAAWAFARIVEGLRAKYN